MAIVKSSFFLVIEMFLEVSASYGTRGAWYQPIEHYALLGQSFMNISGISAVRCSARCLSNSGCFTFNYDRINKVCQLNNKAGGQVCDYFQEMLSVSYYGAAANTMTCQVCVQIIHTCFSNSLHEFCRLNIYTIFQARGQRESICYKK